MKRIISFLTISVVLLSLFGCQSIRNEYFDISSISSFRDIPGITESEISTIEALKSEREYLKYGQMLETEAFILPDGSYSGFAQLVCELLTELFDIEFRLDLYSWEELKSGLDSQTIDFTGDLTPTPERMQLYYMTHPIAERSQRIFMRKDRNDLNSEKDINGLTVGILGGTIDIDAIKDSYPELTFNTVEVDGFDIAAHMIRTEEIDVFITEGVIDPLFEKYGFIKSREFFPLVYTPVSLTTANEGLKDIISVLNKYIIAGGIDQFYSCYRMGNEAYASHKLGQSFTKEESAFVKELIDNNQTIKIALEHDNYPFSFYNKTDKEFQGIAVDVLNEIGYLTGITFELANDEHTPWSEILSMLKNDDVAIVSQLIQTEERKGQFLWTDRPYAYSYYALISKQDYPNLATYQVVRAKVGAVGGSAYEEKYREWFLDNNNLSLFDTMDVALIALETGEIDLLMGAEHLLLTQQNYREKPGYKANIRFGVPTESFFGININEEILCSVINKTQTYVETDIISDNWNNRGFDYVKQMTQQRSRFYLIIAIALFIVFILTVFMLLKNRKLNHNLDQIVKDRTIELEHQTLAAQEASRAKSAFLANMSHEIRTPMNAIIGMTSIGINTNELTRMKDCFGKIDGASKHLLTLINDILDMSKIESGKFELSESEFDFEKLISQIINVNRFRIDEKRQILTVNIEQSIPRALFGDDQRISQVITNLISNAVKFTAEGGSVGLDAKLLDETDSVCTLQISVTDTGIGISEEQQSKLFTSFQQAENSTSRKYGGTGLGLAISKSIIEMMGGAIHIESELGKGSAFIFTIKVKRGLGTLEEEITTVESMDSFEGHCILLVEDIEINREIVLALLEPTKLQIDCAENGLVALEMFNTSPDKYELIFMDMQMPEMDGLEATRQIRKLNHPNAKRIPIIAMTANAFREDVVNCLNAGMNGHLGKPLDFDEVLNKLRNYLLTGLINGLVWDKKFETGSAIVDRQHKGLCEMVNNLIRQCELGKGAETVQETLTYLVDYTVHHFESEEALQQESGYPEYLEHKQIHNDFKHTVNELVERYNNHGSSVDLVKDIQVIVIEWLTNHMQHEDTKIGAFIRSKE
ncbi:MAG: bacteriohemerythrin [Oscillospiraceae bacterium]|nr:bacteriohemerythrin [Oscillospiraceae bacterium]